MYWSSYSNILLCRTRRFQNFSTHLIQQFYPLLCFSSVLKFCKASTYSCNKELRNLYFYFFFEVNLENLSVFLFSFFFFFKKETHLFWSIYDDGLLPGQFSHSVALLFFLSPIKFMASVLLILKYTLVKLIEALCKTSRSCSQGFYYESKKPKVKRVK